MVTPWGGDVTSSSSSRQQIPLEVHPRLCRRLSLCRSRIAAVLPCTARKAFRRPRACRSCTSCRCSRVFGSLAFPLLPDFLLVHRLESCPVLVEGGEGLGGAFNFLGVHSCRQVFVEPPEIPVAYCAFGDSVGEFRIVSEYHQVDELVFESRELFAQGLYMPVILVMRISHCESFLAAIQDDLPLFVVGVTHDEPDACLFLYDENALLCHGDDVDLLYAVAPFRINISEDDALGDCLDSFCGVLFADVSHNLVLKEPHAKDNNTENDYKRYHAIVLLKI